MSKAYKTILAVLVMVFGFGFLSVGAALADGTNEIKVEVWDGSDWQPLCEDSSDGKCTNSRTLFGETNFLPGDTVERNVRITNVDVTRTGNGTKQEIAIKSIGVSNPYLGTPLVSDRFGDKLNFKIKEDGETTYNYEKTLSEFFDESGETVIDTLANDASEKYIFSIYFDETSDNEYQDKSLEFNIVFGLKGDEGGDGGCNYNGVQDNDEKGIDCGGSGCPACGGSGGGGGGGLPQGLIIKYEQAIEVDSNSATITWLTSHEATSQVIYSSNSEYYNGGYQFDLTKINYGYAHAVPNPENLTKVTGHEVIISGLTAGTTYHFRCVSHASPPTVSRSHTFTTLALADDDNNGDDNGDREPTSSPSREGNSQESDAGDDAGGGFIPETYQRWVAGVTDFVGDALGFSEDEESEDKDEYKKEEDKEDGEVRGTEAEGEENGEDGEWQGGTFEDSNGEVSESIFSRYWWWPFILALLLVIFFFWYRKKKKKEEENQDIKIYRRDGDLSRLFAKKTRYLSQKDAINRRLCDKSKIPILYRDFFIALRF